jgi:thymidylate kinase
LHWKWKKMITIQDYGSSKCFSGFFSPQWRLYMSSQCFTERTVATPSFVKIPDELSRGAIFSLTAWNPKGVVHSNAENNSFLERLRSDFYMDGIDCCVYESFACSAEYGDIQDPKGEAQWYEEGITVHCPIDDGLLLPVIVRLAKQYNQLSIFQYKFDFLTKSFVQTQIPVDDNAAQDVPAPVRAVPISIQSHSFLYPSFPSAAVALKVHAARTGTDLGEIGDEIVEIETSLLALPALEGGFRHPVIAIEGIDGCGKSTLCASLVERLGPGAQLLQTPPPRMSRLRHVFDACDENVRRAYYSLCNYSVAQDVIKAAALGPVVVDRYWYSTVAYALAQTNRCTLVNSNIIPEWPQDLLRPSAVLLLTVGEDERQRRIDARGVSTTQEEARLKNKAEMRRQLLEVYRALKPTAEIDGNGTSLEVLEAAVSSISSLLV